MLQPRTNEQVDKKAQFTMIHHMNEHKNNDVCLLESIKNQIWTSKISVVFIVLAGQLRNSRHWEGYKQKRTSNIILIYDENILWLRLNFCKWDYNIGFILV